MANPDKNRWEDNTGDNEKNNPANRNNDLPDNAHDEERMQPEEVTIDIPDVKDIPGQEFIHPPQMESFADTTIASDDEEGVGIFDELDGASPEEIDTDIQMGTEADVSKEDRDALERADNDMPTQDDENLRKAELDQEDFDGEKINEGSLATSVSGADLDTSGVENDDAMENIGEEDEENNTYSLGSDSNDNITEGTP